MDATYKDTWTRDRGAGKPVPRGYELVNVRRNENARVWNKYWMKRQQLDAVCRESDHGAARHFPCKTAPTLSDALSDGNIFPPGIPLEQSCNEWYLFHGTRQETVRTITDADFAIR